MRDVFDVRWFFPPPSSHSTTPHSTTDTPFTQGRLFAGKMQRQFANFLESGKNYFHTISCLLINQAHISKGVCVESCRASLQGVLEICRTNVPPCVRKPLNGIVELTRQQLNTTHDYVMINEYCSDPIEKEYGKTREGMGGTYFITTQNCVEKLNINKTLVLLKLNVDVSNFDIDVGHQCEKCSYVMDEKASSTFDDLEKLEETIPKETKISLCHIAGHVTRNDDVYSEEKLLNTTTFYYQQYGFVYEGP